MGCAALLAAVGQRLRWLTTRGAAAAALVGAMVFWGAGLRGAALLALFFVSGSLLTAGTARRKRRRPAVPAHSPPPLRTARQVIANGGWAAVGAAALAFEPATGWALMIGALAAAQADTWATEIGSLAPTPPRLITTGEVVPAGTSGGVTALGTAGGALGSVLLAALALLMGLPASVAACGATAGLLGMTVDSLLGATVQAVYRCDRCGRRTERPVHGCGQVARRVSGLAWLDNDGVNLAATSAGGLATVALMAVIYP